MIYDLKRYTQHLTDDDEHRKGAIGQFLEKVFKLTLCVKDL